MKSNGKSRSPNCIDTLIGAGMRVVGDIACTGVMRVQGDILGNVSCRDNPNGTLVVDSAGCVTGTVNMTHVAVRGRVIGPVQSSQAIEIHQGGSLAGDISFKELAIHAGGVVEGLLNPTVAMAGDEFAREHRPQGSEEPSAHEFSTPVTTGIGFMERFGGARKISLAILLAIAAVAAAWMGRAPVVVTHPADDAALRADSSSLDSADPKSPPAGGGDPPNEPKATAVDAVPVAPSLSAGARDTAQTPSPDHPGNSREEVVTVRGANPRRPAGVFLLISNEPSVLYRKKRDDPGEGARISVAEGERASVSIAPDELIRVAEGRDVVILFQGQKVSRNTIESGSWISFVPR